MEQETILGFLAQHIQPNFGEESCSHEEYETIGEWADNLHGRLKNVKLKRTDEDRILKQTFRHHEEYEYEDWPPNEFLEELEIFLEENIESSTEYQTKLVGESAVNAKLVCWGVLGR
jgi:hypothetical protein